MLLAEVNVLIFALTMLITLLLHSLHILKIIPIFYSGRAGMELRRFTQLSLVPRLAPGSLSGRFFLVKSVVSI